MTLLREAIEWTIGRLDPPSDAAARARAAVDRCIGAIETTVWPGAAECFSGLNADGCPIEFALSSRDAAVRLTSEAAAPEVRTEERLERARRLLEGFGVTIAAPVDAAVSRLQAAGPLVWGAAVGVRCDVSSDRLKLYAEVPRGAGTSVIDPTLAFARMRYPPALVMVGAESHTGRFERYFRASAIEPDAVVRMLDAIGLADRAGELLHAVEVSWRGSAEAALRDRWGLSIGGPSSGPPDAVSLFKEANRLFGGDARTRARLLDLAPSLDAGCFHAYERVSAPLADSSCRGAHGILSFTIARGRPLELRIGISPAAIFREAQRARRSAAA
jgi:hypothetical protein